MKQNENKQYQFQSLSNAQCIKITDRRWVWFWCCLIRKIPYESQGNGTIFQEMRLSLKSFNNFTFFRFFSLPISSAHIRMILLFQMEKGNKCATEQNLFCNDCVLQRFSLQVIPILSTVYGVALYHNLNSGLAKLLCNAFFVNEGMTKPSFITVIYKGNRKCLTLNTFIAWCDERWDEFLFFAVPFANKLSNNANIIVI